MSEGELKDDFILRHSFMSGTGVEDDVDTLTAAVRSDLEFREKAKPHFLLERYHSPRLRELFPVTIHGKDKAGSPVVYAAPGQADVGAIFDEFEQDELSKYYATLMEHCRRYVNASSGGNGRSLTLVLDLTNLGMAHADTRIINWIRAVSPHDVAHYPYTFRKVYVVNAGWVFSTIWSMMKAILPTSTVELVEILADQSYYMPVLEEVIEKDQIPEWLGGTCEKCKDVEGGCLRSTPPLGSADPNAPFGTMSIKEKKLAVLAGKKLPKPMTESNDPADDEVKAPEMPDMPPQ